MRAALTKEMEVREVDKMNDVLQKLGSSHRVRIGEPIGDGLGHLIDALPIYIDKKIEERLKHLGVSPNINQE